jgi:hypothetical protein
MINALERKYIAVTNPAAIVDNAAYTTTEIDTLGYDYATVLVHIGATDIAMATLKVQESDTSGSGFADITGLVCSGTSGDGRLPTATDDNKIFAFNIDLRGRKRYLDLSATAGDGVAGTYMSAMCILERGNESPLSSAEQGLGGRLSA